MFINKSVTFTFGILFLLVTNFPSWSQSSAIQNNQDEPK